MQTASAIINSKKDALKEKLKNTALSPEEREKYEKELSQWNAGGLLLNVIGAGLSAPTNSIGGIVAATASPIVSYQIGQYFKGKDAEGSTAHLVAHAVVGAAVAAAGGNNALAGGLAAAAWLMWHRGIRLGIRRLIIMHFVTVRGKVNLTLRKKY
ncbi:hypothetical protein ABX013_19210 [Snodgrassella alvi]|uniref:hypothetical protein n=1 Tax=Snodgrassella alvi TaxID=1196083 RepID=UPI00352E86C8